MPRMLVLGSAIGWFLGLLLVVVGVVACVLWFLYLSHPWVWQRWRVLHATRPFRRFLHDLERDYARLRRIAERQAKACRHLVHEDFERFIQVYPLARAWKRSLEAYLGDLPRYHFLWFAWMSCKREAIEAPSFPLAPPAEALRHVAAPWCRLQGAEVDGEERELAAEQAIHQLEQLREHRLDPVRRTVGRLRRWWRDEVLTRVPAWIHEPSEEVVPQDAEEVLHLRRLETRQAQRERRVELQRRQLAWTQALQKAAATFAERAARLPSSDGTRTPRLRLERYVERLRDHGHALATSSTARTRHDASRSLWATRRLLAHFAGWHGKRSEDVARAWARTENVLDQFPTDLPA